MLMSRLTPQAKRIIDIICLFTDHEHQHGIILKALHM